MNKIVIKIYYLIVYNSKIHYMILITLLPISGCGGLMLNNIFNFLSAMCIRWPGTQQTQDSWAKTLYKRFNNVRIDSACRVLFDVLPDRCFLNMKFGGNVMAHLPFKLCVPIRISITIYREQYNFGPTPFLI